ncbi:hypothetical protein D8T65_10500 [Vibrio vulnificus]|uniref:hypothetical protein n=1 Tax=Vibrio vulnificus TaxID=672 RepID=UPI00102A468C|nr:hypothetical protein [Vibrio vulnificus]RZQ02639.1 hypothetical protein D8T65_10500 [Vibrio vulnificus]
MATYNEEQANELKSLGFKMVEVSLLRDEVKTFVIGFNSTPIIDIGGLCSKCYSNPATEKDLCFDCCGIQEIKR